MRWASEHIQSFAFAARGRAIEAYLAYRRAGGESQSNRAQLFALVAQAIAQGAERQAEGFLAQLAARPDVPSFVTALISKLQALLAGSRDPALADDPELAYMDAAEIRVLLEGGKT